MELRDTVKMMLSDDYKERFKAEYWQTKIRYQRLHKMLTKFEAGKLGFELKCPAEMLREQKRQMGEYLHTLEIRAVVENIDLDEIEDEDGEHEYYAHMKKIFSDHLDNILESIGGIREHAHHEGEIIITCADHE